MTLTTQVVSLKPLLKLCKNQRCLEKRFTLKEIKYALSKRFPEQSLGARLAAKKALLSALGKKASKALKLTDIEIMNDRYGKPYFSRAPFKFRRLVLSLAHSEHYAAASVVIERKA